MLLTSSIRQWKRERETKNICNWRWRFGGRRKVLLTEYMFSPCSSLFCSSVVFSLPFAVVLLIHSSWCPSPSISLSLSLPSLLLSLVLSLHCIFVIEEKWLQQREEKEQHYNQMEKKVVTDEQLIHPLHELQLQDFLQETGRQRGWQWQERHGEEELFCNRNRTNYTLSFLEDSSERDREKDRDQEGIYNERHQE